MAPNPRRVDAKLQAIYDRIPAMKNCKGKCADSCGPIELSIRERERIERESGRTLEAPCGSCSMLTPLGRCSVYDLRPVICRIFGTTRGLACEHGCEPERWLDDKEGFSLILEALRIGGTPAGFDPEGQLSRVTARDLETLVVLQRLLRVRGQPIARVLESIGDTRGSATRPADEGGNSGRSRNRK